MAHFVIGPVVIDSLDRETFANGTQDILHLGNDTIVQDFAKSGDNRVFAVDFITNSVPVFDTFPERSDAPGLGRPSPVLIRLAARPYQAGHETAQPVPNQWRRRGSRFLDVQAPQVVKGIRNINAYPREFCEFFLTKKSEPGSPDDEPTTSIDVKSLLSTEAEFSACLVDLSP